MWHRWRQSHHGAFRVHNPAPVQRDVLRFGTKIDDLRKAFPSRRKKQIEDIILGIIISMVSEPEFERKLHEFGFLDSDHLQS